MARKKNQVHPRQLIFDFSKRMEILMKLQTGEHGEPSAIAGHVKHLLRVLDDHARDSTDAYVFVNTLVSEMCTPKRTVERAITIAEERGYLIRLDKGKYWKCRECLSWNKRKTRVCGVCETDRQPGAEQREFKCKTYRLRRHYMLALIRQGSPDQSANVADCPPRQPATLADCNPPLLGGQSANMADSTIKPLKPTSLNPSPLQPPLPFQRDGGSNTEAGKVDGILESRRVEESQVESPPDLRPSTLRPATLRPQDCPPTPTSNSGALGGVTWSDVRAALDVVGCRSNTAIDDAIARARTRGVEPSEALAIVEHAQRCVIGDVAAWGAGAVLHRLAQQRPGDEIGDYWPAPDPAFVAREANERRRHFEEADRAAKARQDAEDARRGEELRQTAVDRERRYGPILDAMDDTQRAALWHSFYPLPFRRAQRLRADLLRQQLLLLVARRFESVDPAEEPGWSGSVDSVCELPSPLSGASR